MERQRTHEKDKGKGDKVNSTTVRILTVPVPSLDEGGGRRCWTLLWHSVVTVATKKKDTQKQKQTDNHHRPIIHRHTISRVTKVHKPNGVHTSTCNVQISAQCIYTLIRVCVCVCVCACAFCCITRLIRPRRSQINYCSQFVTVLQLFRSHKAFRRL